MSEKLNSQNGKNVERRRGGEHKAEKNVGLEKLKAKVETGAERSPEQREKSIEQARRTLEREQLERQKAEKPSEKRESEPVHSFTKKQKRVAYKKEMKQIRAQLPPSSRVFSKIIHNPVIETVSDVASETIFRPSFLITGAVAGLIVGGAIYIIAKIYGFNVPNSQFLLGFLAGGIAGVLGELFFSLFRSKKR